MIKERLNVIKEGMNILQGHIEWNTTFAVQKSIFLQIFGAATCSGMAVLDACRMASLATGFNQRAVHRWAKDVYVDFFSTLLSLDDATDEQLHDELESDRLSGHHFSQMRTFAVRSAYLGLSWCLILWRMSVGH